MIIAVNLGIRRPASRETEAGSHSTYNLELAGGIMGFAADRPDIQLWFSDPLFADFSAPERVDGIIGATFAKGLSKASPETPIVNVVSTAVEDVHQVCCSDREIVKMAVDHFLHHNIRHLAFLHLAGYENSARRKAEFCEYCGQLGFFPHIVERTPGAAGTSTDRKFQEAITALPKPAGVLLALDSCAAALLELCETSGIRVPEELAVLGINNIAELCMSSRPKLSSIDINAEQIGHIAARSVVDLINGTDVPDIQYVAPKELILRESSVPHKGLSAGIAKVVNYMHTHLCEPIVMDDLIRQQSLGRRALEKAFQVEVGESPMHYLQKLRLDRVIFLLQTTELTVTEISWRCGFRHANYLCRLFRKYHNTTPHAYRKRGADAG